MKTLDFLLTDPRLTVRRSGEPDPDGRCVVYWMQRTQRAMTMPRWISPLRPPIALGKPVVVFFRLSPHAYHANLRHYQFLRRGLDRIAAHLQKRNVGFVLRRYPRTRAFAILCRGATLPGDRRRKSVAGAERVKSRIARKIALPFWTVDADVIVPSTLARQGTLCGADDSAENPRAFAEIFAAIAESRGANVNGARPQLCRLAPTQTLLERFSHRPLGGAVSELYWWRRAARSTPRRGFSVIGSWVMRPGATTRSRSHEPAFAVSAFWPDRRAVR